MNEKNTLFTTPLPGSEPCGPNLEYDSRMMELEEDFAGKPEQQIGDSIIPATPPNWKQVQRDAAALMEITRDLRIIVWWTVARLANDGIGGLLDGLEVIRELSTTQWDNLWPVPDDGDVQERLSALLTLSPQPGAFNADMTVIQLLSTIPLCKSAALGSYGLRELREAQEHGDNDAMKLIRAALQDTGADWLEETHRTTEAVLQCLKDIRDCYNEHGQGTPDFRMVTDMLKEMLLFFDSRPAAAPAPETPQAESSAPDSIVPTVPGSPAPISPASAAMLPPGALPVGCNTLAGRNEAVQLMQQLCAWFEENEPSSPVPYFLRRAIRAVGADFMEILADIAPNLQEQARLVLKPDAATPTPRPPVSSPPPMTAAPASTPLPAPSAEAAPVGYINPFG